MSTWMGTRVGLVVLFLAALLGAQASSVALAGGEVPRMGAEELEAKLGSEDLVVIDVRRHGDWDASGQKVKGAVRENPGKVGEWAARYPKTKTIVLYCA